MGRSNVFTLGQIYRKQITQTWSKIPEVFRYVVAAGAGSNFGYFAGGWAECCPYLVPFSTIDRIDFDNDTEVCVQKGALLSNTSYNRGFSSTNHGYSVGGNQPYPQVPLSLIDRIDYANDSVTASSRGTLENAVGANAGTFASADFGYICGGQNPQAPQPYYSLTQRLEFANDTATTSPKGNLSISKRYGGSAGNQSYGYYSGGSTPTRISSVDRIDYSNDTSAATPKGPLSRVVDEHDATGNASYGYHAGGWDPSTPYSNKNDRIDYSSDTSTASPKGNFNPGSHGPTATGNTSYGYWSGGYGNNTNTKRLDYSNDTNNMVDKGKRTNWSQNGAGFSSRADARSTSSVVIPLSRIEPGMAPGSSATNFGYFTGGQGPRSTTFRMDFDSDTSAVLTKGPLTVARYSTTAFAGNQSAGHMIGGYDGTNPGRTSTHDRLDYSNDTNTMEPKANLNWETMGAAATGNTEKGYWWGGRNNSYSPNYLTYVDRITYANSTVTEMPRSTTQGNGRAAAGNANYGWWSGAQQTETLPYMRTWVWRLDYANDTAAPTPKGGILSQGYNHTAAGNSDYGWHVGGSDGVPSRFTYVSRIDYSNDTANALSRANTTVVHREDAGTGNPSYGYHNAGAGGYTITSRIDYSNDTSTPVVRNIMPSVTIGRAGTSPRINGFPSTYAAPGPVDKGAQGFYSGGDLGPGFGYFASARPAGPTYYTMIDRVDYSNDTPNMVQKGSMITTKYDYGSVASLSHGYMGAGFRVDGTNPNTELSSVERSDFSNDTATTVAKGPLTRAATGMRGAGNTSFGYMLGEYIVKSTVDRIDYSNDTATAVVRGNLGMTQANHGAAGNANFAYTAGGFGGPSTTVMSNVNRFDYSNDTANGVEKGPLTYATYDNAGVGNADFGYFMGGGNPSPYAFYSKVDRVDYSNDTVTASTRGSLGGPSTRGYMGTAGNPGAGYVGGGTPGPTTSRVDKIDYSNDTATATAKGSLTAARYAIGGFSAQDNGMKTPLVLPPRVRFIDNRHEVAAQHVPSGTGYFAGGTPAPAAQSIIDRIDFANDTAETVTKGPLTVGRWYIGATSNTSHGYFGAGEDSPNSNPNGETSIVERVDYSNDTVPTSQRGSLVSNRNRIAAVGNMNYGYFVGGFQTDSSAVDRVDYANDTAVAMRRGPLNRSPAWAPSAVGNSNFGYVAGGGDSTIIDRIDYSNDNTTATTKGPLGSKHNYAAGAGNANYGYIGGGGSNDPAKYSRIDRIDYSNDTAATSPKGSLPQEQNAVSAASSPTFGYWAGGDTPSGTTSKVSRLNFASDTFNAVDRSPLSLPRQYVSGTGAQTNANLISPSSNPAVFLAPVQPPFPIPTQLPIPPDAFTLTLESSDSSRLGDTSSVQNTWWGTQTYPDTAVTTIGEQSYQGFYAFTLGFDSTVTATVGGAAGWKNVRGRSITATFTLSKGTRLVFFAGKPTVAWPSGQGYGAAGGASCLMVYDTSATSDDDYENGFYPLIIAAGGGAGGQGSYELASAAPPLTVTTGNTESQIMTLRTNHFPGAGLLAKGGGGGRDGSAQNGGCGWASGSRDDNGGITTNGSTAVGLAYGALGTAGATGGGADGGFGGGGGDRDGNFYGAGAGGYYGGCEGTGATYNATNYVSYSSPNGDQVDDRYGALSYVHSSGTNVTDNGLHGTSNPSNQNSQQIKGRVHLEITPL